jgi:hypothetical protein
MMKKLILQEAALELNDAVTYYEEQQRGLGLRLKAEINETINWIMENPEMSRIREGGYRRVNLKVFPYYIAYIVRNEVLWILAIVHSHREPDYWISRKDKMN